MIEIWTVYRIIIMDEMIILKQYKVDLFVGFSLLNARGIACAGEGDIKTALAMKIADICGTGGSFCEIVAA